MIEPLEDSKRITVCEAIEAFISYLGFLGRQRSTVITYQSRLQVLQSICDRKIDSITLKELQALLKPYADSKARIERMTYSMYVQAVKTFFQWATNKGYIEESPARGLIRPTRARQDQEPLPKDLRLSEASYKLNRLTGDDLSDKAIEFLHYLVALGRSKATIKIYAERLNPLVNYFLGLKVKQVNAPMLDEFIAGLRDHYSPANVSCYIQTCKTFFKFCADRGYISYSPARHLKRARVSTETENKCIRQADLNSLIDYTRSKGMRFEYAALCFMADTGCRVGELREARLGDLDLSRCQVITRGKTGKRVLYFTKTTAKALRDWIEIRPATHKEILFTTMIGAASHARVYHGLERVANELGIKRFNPHAIRHRVGQAWVDRGANLELIRLKLGHRDVTTTASFYTHQDAERLIRATGQYSIVENQNDELT